MTGSREQNRRRESPLRRAARWLFAGREHIDQEGLLAERTLLPAPRRVQPEQDAAATDEGDRPGGDAAP
jgi:hypothetical protein